MKGRSLLLASFIVCLSCESAPPPQGAGVGTPVLAGRSTRGGRFTLRDVAGSAALLLFVRGSYCPICQERLRTAAAYAGAYQDAGVRVVAVTLDAPDRARGTAQELELPFPLVSVDVATFQRWGLRPRGQGLPRPGDFVLDGGGRVRYSRVGADEADRPSDVALLGIVDSLRRAGALPPR